MYKDTIAYKLNEGVTEDRLIEITSLVYADWMKDLDGFVSWEICKLKDGSYLDIVTWRDSAAARASEALMADMPHGAEWMACYLSGSIRSNPMETLQTFE